MPLNERKPITIKSSISTRFKNQQQQQRMMVRNYGQSFWVRYPKEISNLSDASTYLSPSFFYYFNIHYYIFSSSLLFIVRK